jgi:cytochrome P450
MTGIHVQSDIRYEPYDAASRLQQFELYKQMRAQAPVFHTASDWWCVSRYDDILEVLLSPDRFSNAIIQTEAFGLPTGIDSDMSQEQLQMLLAVVADMPVPLEELMSSRIIVAADPPEHTRVRRVVARGFTARRISQLRPAIEDIVDELLAGVENADSYEVVSQLAAKLPVEVIAAFLSADRDDLTSIRDWVEVTMECSSGPLRGTPEGQVKLLAMLKDFGRFFVPRIQERRENPRDDLISDLVRAEESETLTVTEALLFLLAVMVAGSESTASLVSSAVVALYQHPDQLDEVRADPSLVPNVVKETLRFYAPFQFYWRQALIDTQIAGVEVPAGAKILVMPGSANRDPAHFPDPDTFDIHRDFAGKPLLTFGKGIHHCLGAHLAQLEGEIAMAKLLPHLGRFELSDEPLDFPPSFITYGFKRVLLVDRNAEHG